MELGGEAPYEDATTDIKVKALDWSYLNEYDLGCDYVMMRLSVVVGLCNGHREELDGSAVEDHGRPRF